MLVFFYEIKMLSSMIVLLTNVLCLWYIHRDVSDFDTSLVVSLLLLKGMHRVQTRVGDMNPGRHAQDRDDDTRSLCAGYARSFEAELFEVELRRYLHDESCAHMIWICCSLLGAADACIACIHTESGACAPGNTNPEDLILISLGNHAAITLMRLGLGLGIGD